MPSLLHRLREGLPPHYDVERVLGSGGMAHVFRGRDRRLDRPVAIKVLRPERATARGAERFLREARTLARLAHPNLLPVHDVGEAAGLPYMVLALAAAPSLKERLESGPLEVAEAVRVGRDLLDGLAAVHAAGIVHRDVKPSNVFFLEGRAVLGDFGVASFDRPGDETLTRTGETVGTPGYLAPEVAAGEEASPRADVYAAGMVLCEALTGRRWSTVDDPGKEGLEDVPPRLRAAVGKALARRPEERWPDAGAFRDALEGGRKAGRGLRAAAGVALVAAAGLAAWLLLGERGPGAAQGSDALADLTVLPCETVPAADSLVGLDLARLVTLDLRGLPELRVTRAQTAFAWWEAHGRALREGEGSSAGALGSRYTVRCTLLRRADGLEARLELADASGRTRGATVVRGPATDPPVPLGDSVAVAVIRSLEAGGLPSGVLSEAGLDALAGRPFPAIRSFLRGEDAFQRSSWLRAEDAYRDALAIDSAFALARWRLVDVHRWQLLPVGVDLRRLYEEGAGQLGPLDRRLLEARLAPHGPEQHALYEGILADHPNDAYAALLYGDELLHRGPLFGVTPDSALSVLRRAAARDSFFSPILDHVVQAEIRLGMEEDARRDLVRFQAVSAPADEVDIHFPTLWRHAWLERFHPAKAAAGRGELLVLLAAVPGGERQFLATYGRLAGPYFDLPEAALAFGRRLTQLNEASDDSPVNGRVTTGLALYTLGRIGEATSLFDAAAVAARSEEGRVQAAEWRVLPPALGQAGPGREEREEGRRALEQVVHDAEGGRPVHRLRAASALALLAFREGRPEAAARWRQAVERLPAAVPGRGRQRRLLEAAARAHDGDWQGALDVSAPLLAYDSAGHLDRPFERSSVALLRGEWHAAAGDPRAAEVAWRWHENSDVALDPAGFELPGRFAQAAEVDWALGTEARVKAASAALATGRRPTACRLSREADRHLAGSDVAFAAVREEARSVARAACER